MDKYELDRELNAIADMLVRSILRIPLGQGLQDEMIRQMSPKVAMAEQWVPLILKMCRHKMRCLSEGPIDWVRTDSEYLKDDEP